MKRHDAFGEFMEQHLARATRFCSRMLGNHADGEEVAQVAFTKIFEKQQNPWEKSEPLPYLYATLKNACIDHIRKAKKHQSEGLEELGGRDFSLGNAEAEEVRQAVLSAIEQLEPNARTAILLRFFEGLSLAETARSMSKTFGATAMLLSRAKARMKEQLGKLPDFEDLQ
ncbi:MAG: RNA polymerase sigma factor [Planctomycetota bacterium]|jgi:RNA polymerase sigma-70 factor (ECF subfamily)